MPLELVYAAALALLMQQLRDKAPMPELLASVQRLCILARVGAITIRADALALSREDSVGVACRLLHQAMTDHGVLAIDIATTMTDAEFLKLAGLLGASPSAVADLIVERAEALSIWNVRWHTRHGAARRSFAETKAAPSRDEAARGAAVAATDATDALQLTVEQLLDGSIPYDDGHAVLEGAGIAGARALFEQLVAAQDMAERRFLFDIASSLPAIGEVARDYVQHGTWYVARNAAALLGASRAPFAVAELGKLLRHPDARVRVAAVVALGRIGGAAAIARLESVLFDGSIEVRNRALAIVFAHEGDPLPDRLPMDAEEEQSLAYRLEMMAALAHVHTPRARARLEACARRQGGTLDDHQLRIAAVNALVEGHHPSARTILQELAADPNPFVRDRALALLHDG